MERPKIKDITVSSYVDHLESKLKVYEESPLVKSYLACLTTIDCWNEQLIKTEINIMDAQQKDNFAMAHKYLTEMKPYIEQLDYLRKLMSPEQKKEAEGRKFSAQSTAEKHIFKDK